MEEYFIIDIHKSSKNILIILFIGLLIRLILAPFFTSYDLQLFKKTCEWFYTAGLNPLVWWTYGPVLLIILLASYVPYSTFVIISTKHSEFLLNLFIKTPQILGDIIVTLILYKLILYITKEEKKALKVSMLYIFSPFSVILSAVYGYLDSIMVTFILLSLFYLLKYKEKISALLFVASIATKFASIILLPIYLFYLKRHNGSIYKYLLYSFLSSIILSIPYIIMLTKVIDNPLIFLTILIDRAGFLKPYAASISNIPLTRWSIFTFPKEVLGIDFMGFIPGGFPILVLISYFFCNYFFIYKLKNSKIDFHFMNRYIIVILGILLILNPNNVPQFLLWIYPFLIIESIVYNKIPIYIINILWISCLAIFIFAEPLPYIMLHNNIAMNQLSWKLARLFSPFINKYFAALIGFFYVSLLTFIIFYTALNKEIHFKRRL